MNFSTFSNLLKYQNKIDIGTVFAYGLIFPFAPPVASEIPFSNPSPSGTATQRLLHLLLLLIASVNPSSKNPVAIFSERGHSTSIQTEGAGAGDGGQLE